MAFWNERGNHHEVEKKSTEEYHEPELVDIQDDITDLAKLLKESFKALTDLNKELMLEIKTLKVEVTELKNKNIEAVHKDTELSECKFEIRGLNKYIMDTLTMLLEQKIKEPKAPLENPNIRAYRERKNTTTPLPLP